MGCSPVAHEVDPGGGRVTSLCITATALHSLFCDLHNAVFASNSDSEVCLFN